MGKDEAGSINRINYRRHDTGTCTVGSHHPHRHIPITALTLLPPTNCRQQFTDPIAWLAKARV